MVFALLFCVVQSARGMHDLCGPMLAAVSGHADALALPHVALREVARQFFGQRDAVRAFTPRPSPTVPVKTKLLADARESLLARVLLIREAKHTLDLTSYIFEGDEASHLILGELKAALKRGVSVRLLVDSVGTMRWSHPEIRTLFNEEPGFMIDAQGNKTLKRASVDIAVINPITGWFLGRNRLNHRMHDKLLVADAEYGARAVAILGGRNIENGYFHFPPTGGFPLRDDMDVLIRAANDDRGAGSFGRRLEAHVNRLFYSPGTRHLETGPGLPFEVSHQLMLGTALDHIRPGTPFGDLMAKMLEEDYLHRGFIPTDARLVNDLPNLARHSPASNPDPRTNPRNPRHGDSVRAWSVKEIGRAQETIDIVTPYLFLSREEIQFLRNWVQEKPGRRVRIITNSSVTTDNVLLTALLPDIARHFFQRIGDPTSNRLIELHVRGTKDEIEGWSEGRFSSLMHAKYVVLDGKRVLVTSSNGDPRSRWINSEVGAWYDDPATAKQLESNTEALIARSTLWGSPEYEALRSHQRMTWTRSLEFLSRILVKTLRLQPQL